jgi:rubrerythrin
MAVDLRSEIFRLRAEGLSFGKIAEQLGTNKSRVQRELGKTAREAGGPVDGGGYQPHPLPRGLSDDPDVAAEQKAYQLEQLQTQRAVERARRIEAERRVQLMEHPDGGGGNGLAMIVLEELRHLREEQRAASTRSVTPPPPPPAPSLTEQLSQTRQVWETMQSFAPAKPPNSVVDLEYTVAKERLSLEQQRLNSELEMEREERRERMASENRRNDAVAKAIEQSAPLLTAAIENWFKEKTEPAPPLPAPNPNGPTPKPVVVHPEETVGQCPRCGSQLAIAGGQDEKCPNCGQVLVAVEGRIRGRLPNGDLAPPPLN